jgi:phospholipase C
MSRSLRRVLTLAIGSLTVLAAGPGLATAQAGREQKALNEINHIVVIYQENHSFDNLYGGWEGVNGRANASPANTIQVSQNGMAYTCLLQNDVNLTSGCFANQPFGIEAFIPASAKTCPQPGGFFPHGSLPNAANLPGGCTEDIVHRFYQEQYQLNNGRQNRYVTGSDAVGLAMGYYNTQALPIYAYLHSDAHPHYAIADDFFQSAFGGSFLNHQWLIAANSPLDVGPNIAGLHAVLDANGMTNTYPLYTKTSAAAHDGALTQACPSAIPGRACGDFAVNTIQPSFQPFAHGNPQPAQLSAQTGNNIGDELTKADVSWAWYSGGWSNAAGIVGGPGWTNTDPTKPNTCADPNSKPNPAYPYCPNKVFQYHHQAFNYFANYAPDAPGRAHLQDEQAFVNLANSSEKECNLNSVSFVKPIGLENEHPGYTSVAPGSNHLVSLIKSIQDSACAKDTMIVVTYDEFGGQWDHVAPPGQGGTQGPHDQWGPGTRIPALVVSPHLRGDFVVDHTQYDTTSILATIEHRYGLPALGTRDAAVNDLSNVFLAHSPQDE